MNFTRIYNKSKLTEAETKINKEKFESLLSKAGLPVPQTRDEVIAYASAIASFGELSDEFKLDDEDNDAILNELLGAYVGQLQEGVRTIKEPGLFSSGEKEYYNTYVDSSDNQRKGRVGQEYGHYRDKIPSKIGQVAENVAEATLGKLFSQPAIAAALLTVLLSGGIIGGLHMANKKDFEVYHNCQNSICQTYESENDAHDYENGATRVVTYVNGTANVRRRSNPGWDRQQSAIRQFHKSNHDPTAKFDANGFLPGNGSTKKGGGQLLKDYIPNHAIQNFHDIPTD